MSESRIVFGLEPQLYQELIAYLKTQSGPAIDHLLLGIVRCDYITVNEQPIAPETPEVAEDLDIRTAREAVAAA